MPRRHFCRLDVADQWSKIARRLSLTLQQASDILEKTRKHHMHPYIEVWRSVRAGGDTKTKKSKRTLAVSGYVAAMLERARREQVEIRERAGDRWQENDLVFPSLVGTEQDAHNVRRIFRDALR